jgi:hypothetical protein
MAGRTLLIIGWLWPFVVAVAGVAAIAAGQSLRSDREVSLLFFGALLGSPAVLITIANWMPAAWSREVRATLAVAATVAVLAVESVLALYLLIIGANFAGPGLIE